MRQMGHFHAHRLCGRASEPPKQPSTECLRTSLPPSVPSAVPDCAERQDRRLAGDGEQLVECFNTRRAAAAHQDPITSMPPSRFVQPLECIRKPLGPFDGEGVVFYLATHMLQRRRHPDAAIPSTQFVMARP